MPKFFVKQEQIKNNKILIEGQDVKHIKNVLRLNVDDNIQICNIDTQKNYTCGISKIENEKIECIIFNEIQSNTESKIKVNIFQGLPKADKMELIIQKAVELGVFEITPVEMKRCVVKINAKDKLKKQERWQKISESAAKQSGRDYIPKINNVINVDNICNLIDSYDIILVAYEQEHNNTLKEQILKLKRLQKEKEELKVGIVIGPEGGLEEKEVEKLKEHGAIAITLGNRILRTETVALNVLSIIMYELD